MRDILAVLKALADENRSRMLCALRSGELCVCQLVALLRLAPSTVSKHLSILRAARLVDSRKDGRWMYYRLSVKFRTAATGKVLSLLFEDMDRTNRVAADRKLRKKICREDVEALCRRVLSRCR